MFTRFRITLTIALAALIVFSGCGKPPAGETSSSPHPAKAPSGPAAVASNLASLALAPHEARALEFYNQWTAFREKLGQMLTKDGQLKLMLTSDQAKRDFAKGFDGVLPTTSEGAKVFGDQFKKAFEVGKELQAETVKIVAAVRQEPPEVRQAFWSVMTVRGLKQPFFVADSSRLYFVQSSRAMSSYAQSLFEEEAVPLDPADTRPGDDVYDWSLRNGDIQCVSAKALGSQWNLQAPVASADGARIALHLIGCGENLKAGTNIGLLDVADGKLEILLDDSPFLFDNAPAIKVERNLRYVGPPTMSGDGNRVVFICGNQADEGMRRDGMDFDFSWLACWDRSARKARALTTHLMDTLAWPVISGDGSTVMVMTVPRAFEPPPAKLPEIGVSPSAGQTPTVFLVPVYGGTPRPLTLPAGIAWPSKWGQKSIPFSLSNDGKKAALQLVQNGRPQIYFYDDAAQALKLVTAAADGQPVSEGGEEPMISGDGRWIVFLSRAKDLKAANPVGLAQVYRYETGTGEMQLLSCDEKGTALKCQSRSPAINGDGSAVAFIADTELVPGAVSPAMASRVKLYRCDRLVVVNPKTRAFTGFGGRLQSPP